MGKLREATIFKLLLKLFPRHFGSQLEGSAGIVTQTRPCGCLLKAEHIPEKHL